MEGREGRGRWERGASIAAAVLALGPALATAGEDATNVRLIHNSERFAVVKALGGAARALARPECQMLLDEFADGSGRPLRTALQASGLTASEYLAGVFFYDSPPPLCGGSALAMTKPGNRAVLVCGSRFVRQAERSARYAEAVLIHEALHSLGLGENPPSSDFITERIRVQCG